MSDELASEGGEVALTVVVPFYNPGDRLRSTVEGLKDVLVDGGWTFEIIAVSDGSTDGSAASIADLVSPTTSVYEYRENRGKGYALRFGMGKGRGKYIGFIDADGDISPAFMGEFAKVADNDRPDAVLGSKGYPASRNDGRWVRRLLSWVWRCLVRGLFGLPVRDSQAGIKLFRREVLDHVLPRTEMDGFAFDLELLVMAKLCGYSDFIDVPIDIGERSSSTISFRKAIQMLVDLRSIYRSYRTWNPD